VAELEVAVGAMAVAVAGAAERRLQTSATAIPRWLHHGLRPRQGPSRAIECTGMTMLGNPLILRLYCRALYVSLLNALLHSAASPRPEDHASRCPTPVRGATSFSLRAADVTRLAI
jgi:hypothetical protein